MKAPIVILRFAVLLSVLVFGTACLSSAPPTFQLKVDDQLVGGYQAAYCWRATCADGAPPQFGAADYVLLPAGDPIRLNLGKPLPDTLNLALRTEPFGTDLAAIQLEPKAEDVTWDVGVPPGSYILVASAKWSNGDALYFFAVELAGAATE